MFALIEAEETGKRRRRFSYTSEACSVLGMPCLKLCLFHPKNVKNAALIRLLTDSVYELRSLHIRELCFKDGFRYGKLFEHAGFKKLDSTALKALTAGDVLEKTTGKKEAVFFSAQTIGTAERRCLRKISEDFRYVTADVPPHLRRAVCDVTESSGVSPIFMKTCMGMTSAAVFFDKPCGLITLPAGCTAFFIKGPHPTNVKCSKYVKRVDFRIPAEMASEFPDGYPKCDLLSFAVASGAISPEAVAVSDISVAFT